MYRIKTRFGLAVFCSIIICLLLAVLFRSRSYDDPYITYRYADNIRHGSGFVYNIGERVQSTTTPLFTLLLAGLSLVWGDLPHLANLIGVVSLAAGGLLLWELAAIWKAPWAGWAGLLLYPFFPLAITTLGSETPLYIALCLGAFVAYFQRRYKTAAVCAALAALTRPDGILVSLVLAVDFAIQRYLHKSDNRLEEAAPGAASIPWKAVILFCAILLPWFLFAWAYFGSPLPATLAAKQQQGAMAISQRFAQGFLLTIGWYKSWRYVLEAILALAGLVFVFRRSRQWLRFLAWPALYFAAFSLLGVSRYFWYYTPLVPGFFLLVGLGLQLISGISVHLPARWERPVFAIKNLMEKFHLQGAQVLSGVILVALCILQAPGLLRLQAPDDRFAIYQAAGRWLAANTSTGATVGALEVGILGYYAHRPMVDFAGLIRPSVAAQLTGGGTYEHAAIWAVDNYHPSYLVLFPGDFKQLEAGYVAQHCQQVKRFRAVTYGYDKNLLIYDCP